MTYTFHFALTGIRHHKIGENSLLEYGQTLQLDLDSLTLKREVILKMLKMMSYVRRLVLPCDVSTNFPSNFLIKTMKDARKNKFKHKSRV